MAYMRALTPNPGWKHGFKYSARLDNGDVVLYVRNGIKMQSFFMSKEEALQLARELETSSKEDGGSNNL